MLHLENISISEIISLYDYEALVYCQRAQLKNVEKSLVLLLTLTDFLQFTLALITKQWIENAITLWISYKIIITDFPVPVILYLSMNMNIRVEQLLPAATNSVLRLLDVDLAKLTNIEFMKMHCLPFVTCITVQKWKWEKYMYPIDATKSHLMQHFT